MLNVDGDCYDPVSVIVDEFPTFQTVSEELGRPKIIESSFVGLGINKEDLNQGDDDWVYSMGD